MAVFLYLMLVSSLYTRWLVPLLLRPSLALVVVPFVPISSITQACTLPQLLYKWRL